VSAASIAIDGSKFKAVNNRDRNFTRAKMKRRMAQIQESVARYLHQLDGADRQEPSSALTSKTARLNEKIAKLQEDMRQPRETVEHPFGTIKARAGATPNAFLHA